MTMHRVSSSHLYSFEDFLDALIWAEDNFDEGFPGPGFYSREQLTDLVLEAVEDFARVHCADCGVNTTAVNEYYMVISELWHAHGPGRGMLCIGCLENRIGRELNRSDFTDAPINKIFDQSERLRARLTA